MSDEVAGCWQHGEEAITRREEPAIRMVEHCGTCNKDVASYFRAATKQDSTDPAGPITLPALAAEIRRQWAEDSTDTLLTVIWNETLSMIIEAIDSGNIAEARAIIRDALLNETPEAARLGEKR